MMNEAQRAANKRRQLAHVQTDDGAPVPPPAPAAPPEREMSDIAAELRPDVGPGVPVKFVRFLDKSFQVVGMQSGEHLVAQKQGNGREHRIELVTVAGAGCFLITFIDPARREVLFDIVERSSVRTWRLA